MDLEALKNVVLQIATNPNEVWGEPTSEDIRQGRVAQEAGDRNSARLRSATYTDEQFDDFNRQLGQVEARGSGTAYFPGDPRDLPPKIPERVCVGCGRPFRTQNLRDDAKCYDCELDRLCPLYPWVEYKRYYARGHWQMLAYGREGEQHNDCDFWIFNSGQNGDRGIRYYPGRSIAIAVKAATSRGTGFIEIKWNLETGEATLNVGDSHYWDSYWHKYSQGTEVDQSSIELIVGKLPEFLFSPVEH